VISRITVSRIGTQGYWGGTNEDFTQAHYQVKYSDEFQTYSFPRWFSGLLHELIGTIDMSESDARELISEAYSSGSAFREMEWRYDE